MRILKTKWYIVRPTDSTWRQMQLVTTWPFNSLKELKENHYFNPHKHSPAKGEWILRQPDRYIVAQEK